MKQDIILEQLEHISEEYIEEAKSSAALPRRRPRRALRAGIAAACLGLVIMGVIGMEIHELVQTNDAPGEVGIPTDVAGSWEQLCGVYALVKVKESPCLFEGRYVAPCEIIYINVNKFHMVEEHDVVTITFPANWANHVRAEETVLIRMVARKNNFLVYSNVVEEEIYAARFTEGGLDFNEEVFADRGADGIYPFDDLLKAGEIIEADGEVAEIFRSKLKKPICAGMTVQEVIDFLEGYTQAFELYYEWTITSNHTDDLVVK